MRSSDPEPCQCAEKANTGTVPAGRDRLPGMPGSNGTQGQKGNSGGKGKRESWRNECVEGELTTCCLVSIHENVR